MSAFERLKRFIAELKRRKVFHVGSIYLITAWGASLGAAELFPAFGIPEWAVRAFVITAALGFPLALVLAWAFEITPEGVVLDQGSENEEQPEIEWGGSSTTTWAQSESVRVRWQSGGKERRSEFFHDFVLGRDPEADVHLDNNRISRLHAKVSYEKGCWWIIDLSSRNGTVLNGDRITEATPLEDENEVQLFESAPPVHISLLKTADETLLD